MLAPSLLTAPESRNPKTWQSPAMNAVKVENVAVREDSSEIIALFNALIGRVKSSRYFQNAFGGHLELTFYDQDSASKALCMSGYFIHGANLRVSPISVPLNQRSKRPTDDRRNLYVLGLPFSLTKTEFMNLFSRYGTVTHCVILATVDNSSRRRGFVVMSSHQEAKLAMDSLTRTQLKGHCLDISWAVVQRSGGFLDGGDRAIPPEPRPNSRALSSASNQEDNGSANSSTTSISINEIELASLAPSLTPTPTLLVLNLPSLLFSQTQDMHPLFYPFGRIKKLSLVESPSHESTSVIVEYETAAIAQEAKETLHGQFYAGHEILVHYVRHKSALLDLAPDSDAPYDNMNAPLAFEPPARQSLLGPFITHSGLYQGQRLNNYFQNSGFRAQHPSSAFNFRPRHILRSSPVSSRLNDQLAPNSCSWAQYSSAATNSTHHELFV
ncbi:hypothetical protein H2248_012052 [Termitomyces sp. 'cryptogamus']|nr:hypothetical protein H2248_012052 [Termitomyces sp. 'cryptogamus']